MKKKHKPEPVPHELSEEEMLDPHGNVTHEHVILSSTMLLAVLLILLFFTFMTVAASRAEIAIADGLNIDIPQWVNVSVAMTIAVIKAIFVALFFMQLKYDNKLNAVVAATCIAGLGLFLGFSMLDLGTRGVINPEEQNEIQLGGGGLPRDNKVATIVAAKNRYIEEHTLKEWEEEMRAHHGDHLPESASWSGPDQSRPRRGPTGLFDEGGAEHSGH